MQATGGTTGNGLGVDGGPALRLDLGALGGFEPVKNNAVFESTAREEMERNRAEGMGGMENTIERDGESVGGPRQPTAGLGHDALLGTAHADAGPLDRTYGGDGEDGEKEYEKLMREARKYLTSRRKRALALAVFWILVTFSIVQFFYLSPMFQNSAGPGELRLRREHWWQLVFTKWSDGVESLYNGYEGVQEFYVHAVTWHPEDIHAAAQCTNTAQGPFAVTDDRGYYCAREDLDVTAPGCCLPELSEQYTCQGCEGQCCQTFEVCVSCCLGDEDVVALEFKYAHAPVDEGGLDLEVDEENERKHMFEVCTALCRTSSLSITQDNNFLQPEHRFCHAT
mmetsp:Transcript_22265/g.87720  ORF Transcript_22265/g.87720 Transcript_22265/m.87720 type:complete len:339 (+) Transcript_22265:44-1060(+)